MRNPQSWWEFRGYGRWGNNSSNNNNFNNNYNMHNFNVTSTVVRQFGGGRDYSPGGRGGAGGRSWRGGGSGRGGFYTPANGSRSRTYDGGRPEPMDVVCENSGGSGGGCEGNVLSTTTTMARQGASGGPREEPTPATGLVFVRLMEAVLGTLRGGGGSCDETSCAVRM